MKNDYKIDGNLVIIYLNNSRGIIIGEAIIDLSDLEKAKSFPNTWRLQRVSGREEVRGTYRENKIKKQTTLSKWILDFPQQIIYFKDGNTLNLSQKNLTFMKPLKGNKVVVNRDISYLHIARRKKEDLVILLDTDQVELVSQYTWICEWKKDIQDYVIYTKVYEENVTYKLSLRALLMKKGKETGAYFKNGNRLDFRLENLKTYSEGMTNDYYIENNIAYIFVKVKNKDEYVVTMIDEEDFERVNSIGYTWNYIQTEHGDPYIVNSGKGNTIYLHRFVMNCPPNKVVDHIYHNTLDNRKKNLRNVSIEINQQNRKGANRNSKSGYRNVNWDNRNRDWIVTCGGKYLMRTKDFEEAKIYAIRYRNDLFGNIP